MSATEIHPTKEQAVENVFSQASAVQSGPFGRLFQVYQAFQERREALGLSNPGTTENIAREQTDVFLSRQTFSGLRADLRKTLSGVPIFQVAHSLSMGSQVQQPYSYTAIYGTPRVRCVIWLTLSHTDSSRFLCKAPLIQKNLMAPSIGDGLQPLSPRPISNSTH